MEDLVEFLEEKKHAEIQNRFNLATIENDFYKTVVEEIKKLENEVAVLFREGKYDSGSKKSLEVERAKKLFSEIITMRVKKIIKSIMGEKKPKNMTPEEESFYAQLQNYVNDFMETLFKGTPEEVEEEEEREEKYILVRVVAPILKLALPNRDLFLRKEDVVHLPEKVFRSIEGKNLVKEIRLED